MSNAYGINDEMFYLHPFIIKGYKLEAHQCHSFRFKENILLESWQDDSAVKGS